MKRLTLCIAGSLVLATGAWGCADDTPDEGLGSSAAGGSGVAGTVGSATGRDRSSCAARTGGAEATHIVVSLRWPATLALEAGEGEMHLWTRADLTVKDGVVTGTVRPCGTVIPALTKTAAIGGGQVQIEIPGSVWDAPSMPVFQLRGTSAGFGVGAAITMEPVASLLGAALHDPRNDAWPAGASQLTTTDPDGDGQPGLKAVPRTDPPFAAPPLDLAGVLDPKGARADEVDLATRTVLSLAGARDSCTSAAGTANVTRVDSHVVGCHVRGGGRCTAAQADFVDIAQPHFEVRSATFRMVDIPATATCADVRAALPVH
jgi:hypothetical protein